MRGWFLLCLVLFAGAMTGVRFAAHEFVGAFGAGGAVVLIAAMYLAARYFERA